MRSLATLAEDSCCRRRTRGREENPRLGLASNFQRASANFKDTRRRQTYSGTSQIIDALKFLILSYSLLDFAHDATSLSMSPSSKAYLISCPSRSSRKMLTSQFPCSGNIFRATF